ncbi:Glycine cleavage system transcriptional activator (plasmid) [Caballeronia sp. SBC1]|uniref:LysR substrate-binding domain-containing protein n=1 Tax=unclassified Caballeronia TaxID=2646786 RepID=UPI0013E1E744|nr:MULTISPECIES: LysR substrate-binding domain-containing protein [unclassified Caballeronia]QIE29944.1 Glycine cleavage system transcriptional activator [Caballeronia sp. SBC2]QIN67655.1 Glycine cleavage system transcriptional activator [Caballeronia sp. SBC1]
MRQKLPPLNALRIFEVAARAESYSAAARELNLTHGAVSRQIAVLEDWLGQPLFVRDGQSMVASPHARALAREISAAFDHIADASERYGKNRHVKIIRVSASATVAMRWLIPRLHLFAEICPEVDVRVSTVLSTEPAFSGSFDVAIRREVPSGGQFQAWPLYRESNTVIASPSLLSRTGVRTVEQLVTETWLTSETRPRDWEAWLEATSQPALRASRTLRFDHFFVTLQAVVDGLGFGIGPFPTLDSDCATGRLQKPFPALLSPGSTYYALIPLDADKPLHMRAFVDWLQSISTKDN